MFTVDGLTIEKDGSDYSVSDGDRSFTVDGVTGQPSKDWFCAHPTIMQIMQIVIADIEFTTPSDNGND